MYMKLNYKQGKLVFEKSVISLTAIAFFSFLPLKTNHFYIYL